MFEYLYNVFIMGRNGCFSGGGGGGLNFVTKKSEIFHFSCMLVIGFTVSCLLMICSAVINGKNHVKSHQNSFVFLHMKYYNEKLLELPLQYIYTSTKRLEA